MQMRTTVVARSVGLAVALLCPFQLDSQSAQVVRSESSCPDCRIDLIPITSAGASEDTLAYFDFLDIDSDSKGRIVAAPSQDRTQFFVFDRGGKLRASVGRSGEGPGEFRGIYRVTVGPADSIHVFDTEVGRWSIFSPDFRFVRSQRTAVVPFRAFFLRDGRAVINSVIATRDRAGLPLHIVEEDGTLGLSFGGSDPTVRPDQIEVGVRAIAPAADGSVWSAYVDRYRIERWGIDGRLKQVLVRDADWFPKRTDYAATWLDNKRPPPETRGVWQGPDGYLYVAVRVPDANWRRSDEARREESTGRRAPLPRTAWSEYVDTIIEVIDPVRGRVLASIRVPGALEGFTRAGLMYSVRETDSGAEAIDVFRVQLKSP